MPASTNADEPTPTVAMPVDPSDRPPPSAFGVYQIVRMIGQGGMGAIYLATDRTLDRQVAVKTLRPELAAHSLARDRFLREARAVARLDHEHIVPIYAADEQDGIPYLVMPLLTGEALDARLARDQPLSLAEACRIGREIATGLAAAHARGIIHRDIKPANVWLEGTRGKVRLLDFGLARTINGTDSASLSGTVVGTPAYMAPEQAAGEKVDARADLFSLGCVLYQMATGVRPFTGPHVMAVLTALAVDEPPAANAVNPAVTPELAALIARLMAKSPTARPSSAGEVAELLTAIQAGLSIAGADNTRLPVAVAAPPIWMSLTTSDGPSAITLANASPPARSRPSNRVPLLLAGGGLLVILVVGSAILIGSLGGLSGGSTAPSQAEKKPSGSPSTNRPSTVAEKSGPPVDITDLIPLPPAAPRSAFDDLDPAKIPATERIPGLPQELVGVVGSYQGRLVARDWGTLIELSPDAKWLAKTSLQDCLIVETDTLKLRYIDFVPRFSWEGLAFSPDSKTLAVGRYDLATRQNYEIGLIDLTVPEPSLRKQIVIGPRRGLAFAWLNQTMLAVGTHDGGISLWDTAADASATPIVVRPPTAETRRIQQLVGTATPTGFKIVAVYVGEGIKPSVEAWTVTAGSSQPWFTIPAGDVECRNIGLSPDGQLLVEYQCVASLQTYRTVFWNLTGADPKEVHAAPSKGGQGAVIAFSPNGKTVRLGNANGPGEVWDISTGLTNVGKLPERTYAVTADGRRSVQCTDRLRVCDAQGTVIAESAPAITGSNADPLAVGDLVLTSTPDLRVWRAHNGALLADPRWVPDPGWGRGTLLQRSPSGTSVGWIIHDREYHIADTTADGLRSRLTLPRTTPSDEIRISAWAAEPGKLFTRQFDGTIRRWDLSANPPTYAMIGSHPPVDAIGGLIAHPSGKLIACYNLTDPVVTLFSTWSRRTWQLGSIPGDKPKEIAFSRDGRHLLVNYQSDTVRRFDLTQPTTPGEILALPAVYGLRLSPDGRKLLASEGVSLTLYDYPALTRLQRFPNYDSYDFTPDSRHLLVSTEGVAYVLRFGTPPGPLAVNVPFDLLAAADPAIDGRPGAKWSREGPTIRSPAKGVVGLPLPVTTDGSYTISAEVRLVSGTDAIYIMLPVKDRHVYLTANAYSPTRTGFGILNGKKVDDNATTTRHPKFALGESHTLTATVTLITVKPYAPTVTLVGKLDDLPEFRWTGPITQLTTDDDMTEQPGHLGLGTINSCYEFRSVTLTPQAGTTTRLR